LLSRRLIWVAALAVAGAAALSIGMVASDSGGSANNGGLPSWLPKASVPVGRIVTASAAHPWLAIEGDSVLAKLAHGSSLVTVVGPAVTPSNAVPPPPTTRCSFTVTLARSTGVVPISAAAFTITDQYGQVHQPVMSVPGGGRPPSVVRPGRTVTLTLRTVLPTGSGTVRWTPSGTRPTVGWDFNVEID
jgi:hypothetical protein